MNKPETIQHEELNFRISSHLKSVIGRDLITDDNVAIFELVKNSFDARAEKVSLYFDDENIYIIDNGKGMDRDDIVNKWLFVAYSAKQEGTEDQIDGNPSDYRENLEASRRYAGSKGVGRFSCDRLGVELTIQSKKATSVKVSNLSVNWDDFEQSIRDEFANITVQYNETNDFDLPDWVKAPGPFGTIIHISSLREEWIRPKLQHLKQSLAKLINPFGQEENAFKIELNAPNELDADIDYLSKTDEADQIPNKVINGDVENFIFKTLQQKTTWIKSWIDEDQGTLITELIDRDKVIYRISEPLQYEGLKNSHYECNLFYLNRAAKMTFAKRMGVSSVEFGSIFLFKNGFRVYPIGETTDDSFGIDRRKQQGYARYLGTRDLLGRIDVFGDDSKFKESSSRDKGLIETDAYYDLEDCLWEKSLKRLERYVVDVSWTLKLDMDSEDASFLSGDEARSRVIDVLAKLTSSPDITVEYYASDLLEIISNKSSGFEKTIDNISSLAERLGDLSLAERAQKARQQFEEMQRSEAQALEYAEKERVARQEAERKALKAEKQLVTEKEKNLFLSSQQTRDKETLEILHHQVVIYATNALNQIQGELFKLKNSDTLPTREELVDKFGLLLDWNQHIIAASRFATSANFKMRSNKIEEDLPVFIKQYIENICPMYESRLTINVTNNAKKLIKKFTPIEISIIIDNLIDNAKKARANTINFELKSPESNFLEVLVNDDGFGIPKDIENFEEIFNKGVTTTEGSGIGLYNVKQYLESINGSISVQNSDEFGTTFKIRIYE